MSLDIFPLTPQHVLYYISHLNLMGYASTSITSYVSALGFLHRILDLPDPTLNCLVQKVLAGVNKIFGKVDSRLPITTFILHRLVLSTTTVFKVRYHRILLNAMFLTAFFGLFRVGEITMQKDGSISLFLKDVTVLKNSVDIAITNFKHNEAKQPFVIHLLPQQCVDLCPVRALTAYLELRGSLPGPLFCFADLKPIPREFFTSKLKACLQFCGLDTHLYLSHSFRVGAASYLAAAGYTALQIKTLGRWKSDAFKRYIRQLCYHLGS